MSEQETRGVPLSADHGGAPVEVASCPPPAAGAQSRSERRWLREVLILVGFLAAGVAVTWPRATYITGGLPLDARQAPLDVWSLWWVAHQITHLGNPWFTRYLAAPVGMQLGFDTLMPLVGVIMAPVTLLFGPSASFNSLAIVTPGLAAYAMYRAGRLWLPSRIGALAAGAFYGFSGMLASQDWEHLHTAIGCVFLPLTLVAAVRFMRGASTMRAIALGAVVGAAFLADQEAGVLAAILAALALLPWLLRQPSVAGMRSAAIAVITAAGLASPQVIAMVQAGGRGGPKPPPLANYVTYAGELPSLFSPSPRLAQYGLTGPASLYQAHTSYELLATFGVVLTLMAALGAAVRLRHTGTVRLAVLWLGCAALALGPTLYLNGRQYVPLPATWHGLRVSLVMPYSWFIRVPGLSSFREADRLALLGLVGAALLAGAAVDWLRDHAWPLIVVVSVLAAFEAGWPGDPGQPIMPTAVPAIDRQIALDHSRSVVLDVPFIVRGPQRFGGPASPYPIVLGTADGHPRAMAYTAGMPSRTVAGIRRHPFYAGLVAVQKGQAISPADLAAARRDLKTLHIGWVLVWSPSWALAGTPAAKRPQLPYPAMLRYLKQAGFGFAYRADGVSVYRPATALSR